MSTELLPSEQTNDTDPAYTLTEDQLLAAFTNSTANENQGEYDVVDSAESSLDSPTVDQEPTASDTPRGSRLATFFRGIGNKLSSTGDKLVVRADEWDQRLTLRSIGRSAAKAATKSERAEMLGDGIGNNRVAELIHKIGMNTSESQSKDGMLVKRYGKEGRAKARAEKQARLDAFREKDYITDSEEAESEAYRMVQESADKLEQARQAAHQAYNDSIDAANAKADAIRDELLASAHASAVHDGNSTLDTVAAENKINLAGNKPTTEKQAKKDAKKSKKSSGGYGGGISSTGTDAPQKPSLWDKALQNGKNKVAAMTHKA